MKFLTQDHKKRIVTFYSNGEQIEFKIPSHFKLEDVKGFNPILVKGRNWDDFIGFYREFVPEPVQQLKPSEERVSWRYTGHAEAIRGPQNIEKTVKHIGQEAEIFEDTLDISASLNRLESIFADLSDDFHIHVVLNSAASLYNRDIQVGHKSLLEFYLVIELREAGKMPVATSAVRFNDKAEVVERIEYRQPVFYLKTRFDGSFPPFVSKAKSFQDEQYEENDHCEHYEYSLKRTARDLADDEQRHFYFSKHEGSNKRFKSQIELRIREAEEQLEALKKMKSNLLGEDE